MERLTKYRQLGIGHYPRGERVRIGRAPVGEAHLTGEGDLKDSGEINGELELLQRRTLTGYEGYAGYAAGETGY